VGDIGHIAALIAPRPVSFVGGVTGNGMSVTEAALLETFESTQSAFTLVNAKKAFTVRPSGTATFD